MWRKGSAKAILFCVLIACSALAYAQSDQEDPAKKKTTTTTTTTMEPTTTTMEPTTSTPAPTTQAPTTTPEPTKPPTTSTTTTPKSTTTTEAPTTTTAKPTPKPTPYPKPAIGKWNTSCILVQMAAQFNFTYETKDNKTVEGIFNIPKDANVTDDTCLNMTNQMELKWGPNTAPSFVYLQFDKNGSEFSLYTMILELQVSQEFPDAKENQTRKLLHIGQMYKTPLHMSYHCTREQVLNMTASVNDPKVIGTVKLTDVQFEAFKTSNSTKFSTAKDCDAIDTPDIVPIAVGIALAALILVVLVAYLVARRRAAARGYMSF